MGLASGDSEAHVTAEELRGDEKESDETSDKRVNL